MRIGYATIWELSAKKAKDEKGMHEHRKRILFLCAHRSVRSLMAASLFAAQARGLWDIWSTPVTGDAQDVDLARQVLDELGITLLTSAQTTEPSFGLSWDEGVILLRFSEENVCKHTPPPNFVVAASFVGASR